MRSDIHKASKTKEQLGTVGVYERGRETMTVYDEDSLLLTCCHPSPLTCADTTEEPCLRAGREFPCVGAEIQRMSERLRRLNHEM